MKKIHCLFRLEPDEEKALSGKFFSVEPMMCVCQYFGLLLKKDGHAELIGEPNVPPNDWKPFRAEEWTGIVRLYKSEKHIVGLKQNGTVVACGYNGHHQCETDGWQNIREIYISDEATAGIDANGTTHHTYTFKPVNAPTLQPAPSAPDPLKSPSKTIVKYMVTADNTITITKCTGEKQNVIIPRTIKGKTVTSIGNRAFYKCTSLTTVTIPDSVTTIGSETFSACTSLTSVTIPDSVTTIGILAFAGCTSLTSVTIPNSVTTIEDGAFVMCTSLTSVTIPDSVTSIGDGAFAWCGCLTSVTLPDSVTHIGEGAFSWCGRLTICGHTGSYAETYAQANNIRFSVCS